jgi:hypothetical protein
MPTINQLPSASTLSSSDQLPVYSSSNGDARKASLSALLAWFRATFASPDFETVLEAPTGSGFNIQLAASTESLWLIANPTGAFAAGTITLPPVADCFDGQEIIVTCSQAVTALTVDGNGATVLGEPSSLGTGGFFALRFRKSQSTWYTTSQSLGSLDTIDDLTLTGSILDASGNELVVFQSTASAVNSFKIENSATGNGVEVKVAGDDASIDLILASKGASGDITLNAGDIINLNGQLVVTGATVLLSTTGTTITGTTDVVTLVSSADGALVTTATVVANLGSAATKGQRKFVTDSNAAMTAGIGAVVAGGGANNVPVYSDGTNWRIG